MLGGQGADFLRRVAFRSIRSSDFAEIILRDRCSTSYDLASLLRGRRGTLDTWTGKITKHIGARKSRRMASFVMLSPSKMRKSRRIASFLMLPTSKVGEFLHFGRYQVHTFQKLRKSHRIASFSSLRIADRQIDR